MFLEQYVTYFYRLDNCNCFCETCLDILLKTVIMLEIQLINVILIDF